MGWVEFILALLTFMASHAIPTQPRIRAALVRRLGLRPYLALYSLTSLALLWWLFAAAARAPHLALFPPLYGAPIWGMPLVCWLWVEGLRAPNALSLGRSGPLSHTRPHPLAPLTRHPLLLGMTLWALLHILANPDLAHVGLFGLLGGFPALAMGLIDRRKARQMGRDWESAASGSARFNPRAILRIRPTPLALLGAGALYGALLTLHRFFAGVPVVF